MSRARDACHNYLSLLLMNIFLFSRAFTDMLMCNAAKSMQEDIKMVVHRELLTIAHAESPVITKMLRHRNCFTIIQLLVLPMEPRKLHARVNKRLFH